MKTSYAMAVNQKKSKYLNNTENTKTLKVYWFVNSFTVGLREGMY